MWSAVIFLISLVGFVVLFGLKTFELARNAKTPLHHIRRVGDPILTEGWARYSALGKKLAWSGFRLCVLWLVRAVRTVQTTFDATVHAIATRLNRYLRTRRLNVRHVSDVSTHLKTVLEKTEKKATEADSA